MLALDGLHGARDAPFDHGALAFRAQHGNDLQRRVVAKQLAQFFFVPSDTVALDQRDEVARPVASKCGAAKVGVLRQEVRRVAMNVGEVATPAAGDADFFSDDGVMLDEHYTAAALAGPGRAHHAGSAGADHDDVARRGAPRSQCPERLMRHSRWASRTWHAQGSKNSRTLSNQLFARGLCALGSCALIASNSRSSSFCREVSFTGVSIATWQKRSP